MTAELISPEAVAILLSPAEETDSEAAGQLVRRILSEAGLPPWDNMEIELFPGCGGTLLIARPTALITECFAFSELEELLPAANMCNPGWPSCLYGYEGDYYLMLHRPAGEDSPELGEFTLLPQPSPLLCAHIREHGRLMIPKGATGLLQKFFS